jgi:hypothetical protein
MLLPKSSVITGTIITIAISACHRSNQDNQPLFDTIPTAVTVPNTIKEASGMVASRSNPGSLWVHEDSGTPAQILLITTAGSLVKVVVIDGAVNIDWEDMSLGKGPDPSLNYLYLGDVGDNSLNRTDCAIYRLAEPSSTTDTVRIFDKIRFRYPDGHHDAEAILVEDNTKDIYIITKSDNPSAIYKLPYPHDSTAVNQAVLSGKLRFGGVTGAAMSPDNREILIKTYPALNYFVRVAGESIEKGLQTSPVSLLYQIQPQGEAISFAADNSGFYMLSEKAFSSTVNLFFYKRN